MDDLNQKRELVGVGIIGVQPGRSWAAKAHIPALRAMPDIFRIVGIANTTLASAKAAASELSLPKAFSNADELIACPDVDIVVIAVRVPHHLALVKAAIIAGKHVYCEWPLGNGLAEAEELAVLAHKHNVLAVVGTQARVTPVVTYLRQLVAEGYVGEVLSTTLTAHAGGWGGVIPDKKTGAYLQDKANGATMLTIPLGHALAAMTDVLGDVAALSAILATRRTSARVLDTGEHVSVSAPDQVLISGTLVRGAPVSIHYRGGMPRDGKGFTWEINGTKGDLRVTAAFGHPQMVQLSLEGVQDDEKVFRPLPVPSAHLGQFPEDVVPGNVARVYARMADDLRDGSKTAPCFDDAVALHKIIAAIESAAETGLRTRIDKSL